MKQRVHKSCTMERFERRNMSNFSARKFKDSKVTSSSFWNHMQVLLSSQVPTFERHGILLYYLDREVLALAPQGYIKDVAPLAIDKQVSKTKCEAVLTFLLTILTTLFVFQLTW